MTDRAASALILQILRETAWILIDFVIRKIKVQFRILEEKYE